MYHNLPEIARRNNCSISDLRDVLDSAEYRCGWLCKEAFVDGQWEEEVLLRPDQEAELVRLLSARPMLLKRLQRLEGHCEGLSETIKALQDAAEETPGGQGTDHGPH
uniref:Uncharacterized protein n=1 Tax=viral metagenome TaxID=1070528 RepID=A0A6M3LAK8_9ZZZZ